MQLDSIMMINTKEMDDKRHTRALGTMGEAPVAGERALNSGREKQRGSTSFARMGTQCVAADDQASLSWGKRRTDRRPGGQSAYLYCIPRLPSQQVT